MTKWKQQGSRNNHKLLCWWLIILLLFVHRVNCNEEEMGEGDSLQILSSGDGDENNNESQDEDSSLPSEEEGDEILYFYWGFDDAKGNVIEFTAPPRKDDEEEPVDRPDFLYSEKTSTIRIVEFYAHWCPHCQHFRNHYVEFAKKMKALAKRYGLVVDIYAVSCVPHKSICRDQGLPGYPGIKVFQPGSVNGTSVSYSNLHPFQILRDHLGMELDEGIDEESLDGKNNIKNSNKLRTNQKETSQQKSTNDVSASSSSRHFLPRTRKEVYNDAHLSFQFAMIHELFTKKGPLTNTTLQAFEEWIYMLQAFLPPTWRLHKTIDALVDDWENVTQSEDKLIKVVKKHPPKTKVWSSSCSRGKGGGYTCGLWELFHIASVGLVEYNSMGIGDDWTFWRAEDVAVILRNYVEHFFGCDVCRMNFLNAFDNCALDRCNRFEPRTEGGAEAEYEDWKEFPMWLFETHNAVNARLLRERAERENRILKLQEEVDVQWPPRSDCRKCWHDDGRWDPVYIWKYLRLTYWPEDEISAQFREELYKDNTNFDAEDDDNDNNRDDENRLPWWCLPLIPGLALILFGTAWYRNRRRLIRTGRHKKYDYL